MTLKKFIYCAAAMVVSVWPWSYGYFHYSTWWGRALTWDAGAIGICFAIAVVIWLIGWMAEY